MPSDSLFTTYNSFFVTSAVRLAAKITSPHCVSHRDLSPAAAGVPVVPGLGAAPGSPRGLLLLPPHPLLLLLPRLRPLLCSHPRGACGGAQLQRTLPFGPFPFLLWADRVSRVLSGVLRDLPSQLEVPWTTTLMRLKLMLELSVPQRHFLWPNVIFLTLKVIYTYYTHITHICIVSKN